MLKEVFKETKEKIKGNRLMALAVMAMYMIIGMTIMGVSITNGDSIFCGIFYLLLFPLAYGMVYYFYNIPKGTQKLEDLIEFYIDYKTGLKLILAIIWYMFIVCIGTILLVVPGIIWSYRYAVFMFLMFEDRNITISESFKKSAEIMKGFKFKLFLVPLRYMILPLILYFAGIIIISMNVIGNVKENGFKNFDGEYMSDETDGYFEAENQDGTVSIYFDPVKEGTYAIEEDDSQFKITVNKEANVEKHDVSYSVTNLDESGLKVIEAIAKEYEVDADDEKVTVTVLKPVADTEEDAVEEVIPEKDNSMLCGSIGGIIFALGLIWLILVSPKAVLAEVIFYNKLVEKNNIHK